MKNIPNIDGVYYLQSLSGGTYHELTMVPKGTVNAEISVAIRRDGADSFEQLTNYLLTTPTTLEIAGSIIEVRITTSNTTGTGVIFTQLISKDSGIFDSISRSRAYVQSIARVFPAEVALVTPGRPHLNYVAIQNRDNQAVYFWHGQFPTNIAQTAYLPLDPTTWTAQQKLDAATFISTYGEKIAAGERYEPNVAQTGPLYSYVPSLTAIAHVMVG